ncbi:MAG: hypothetical protein H6978_01430 [Gammaproteobacteria bacterium]|nr:hypothetical protein [Gammaproteobacteria bacterium]
MRDSELEAEVADLYDERLPYHNFAHALDVVAAGEDIIHRCEQEGVRIDSDIVYAASLFHDAGFHRDHAALGFDCKEAYSAALAEEILPRHERFAGKVGKVVDAIMATGRDGSFTTTEQKAVRAADLSGLAAPFDTFFAKALALREEAELLSGKQTPWGDWVRGVERTLRFYLSQEIRLTSYYLNDAGESKFHSAVRTNLERLLKATEPAGA